MRLKNVLKIAAVTLAVAAFAACSPCRKAEAKIVPPFANQVWQLEAVNGAPFQFIDGMNYTIVFGADGRIAGKADCNRYFATYTYAMFKNSGKLKISPLGSTKMMCVNPAQENDFMMMVEKISKVEPCGDQMFVTLDKGRTMVFRRK